MDTHDRDRGEQQVTLWQRIWASPWTYLALGLWFIFYSVQATTTAGRILWLVFGCLEMVMFFAYADKRWGKRL
jgi:hypothetical protein